jgi:two-component system, OmpR family, sensor histidine kinase ChvG
VTSSRGALARLRSWLGRVGVRLLVVNVFIVLVPVAGLEFAKVFEAQLLSSLERDMRNQSALVRAGLEADLSSEAEPPLSERAYAIEGSLTRAARSTRTRLRVLDLDGAVLADSHVDGPPEGVEPRAPHVLPQVDLSSPDARSWPGETWPTVPARAEVLEALGGNLSTRTRIRDREPAVLLFLAEPILVGGEVRGVVYVTRSTQPVLLELYRIRTGLLTVLGVAVALAVALSILLAIQISRPLSALVRASREVEAGHLHAPIGIRGQGEIRELCEAFSHMRDRLVGRLLFARELASDVAHEFKSPLTSIRGAAELLRDGAWEDGDARDRFLDNILGDASRLTELSNRLLELGRIEAREAPVTEVDLGRIVRELASRRDGVVVEDSASRALVLGRADDLAIAVGNLLENALEHRDRALVGLRLTSTADAVVVAITNDGPGISAANRGRVFDRFFTTRRARGGTGLGLAIVRSIAEAHRGQVEVESEPGETTFRLVLPGRGRPGGAPLSVGRRATESHRSPKKLS